MSEKTEKATPWALKKAKEQGLVSQSTELSTCLFLLALLGVLTGLWSTRFAEIKQLIQHVFILNTHMLFSVDNLFHLQQFIIAKMISLWLPFALAGLVSLILSSIAQTGFVWTGTPLIPNFKRLHISQGFKRLFSSKLIVEALKNSMKFMFVLILLFLNIKHELKTCLVFATIKPAHYTPMMIKLLSKILLQLLGLLFIIAIIDKRYKTWTFEKEHRMTKQQVKDEYRQREGDPKIKFKIKQLQQKLRLKSASLEQVKTADVVITNPTHLAIVLKYDRGLMPAPKVVCKAQGEMVKQVKHIAARHQIPIIENKAFARALFASVDLNQWIDKEHYPMAALIFREIYRQKAS